MDYKKVIREKSLFFVYIFLIYCSILLFRDIISYKTPEEEPEGRIVCYTPFYQNDPRWKDQKIGGTGYTLEKSGCLITLASIVLEQMGYNINPGRLNTLLNHGLGYDDKGWLQWNRLVCWFPGVEYSTVDYGDREFLKACFDGGVLPMIMVRGRRKIDHHWVLMVGYKGEEIFLFDPLVKGSGSLKEYDPLGPCRILSR